MKILFAGEGGQGVQAIAEILAKAAFQEKKYASYIPNFGVEQRGGVSLAFVIIDRQPIVYPKFEKADILALLSNRSIERTKRYIEKKTKIILSPAVTKKFKIENLKLKIDHLSPRVWNVAVLGRVNKIGKLVTEKSLIKAMDERFARQFKKRPELRKLDLEALKQ